jgi:hypothetical protein
MERIGEYISNEPRKKATINKKFRRRGKIYFVTKRK